MTYTSINQIRKDFDLETQDLEILRDRLNNLRTELHPDRNNGNFKNENEKDTFIKINNAIEYIDSFRNSNQLVVVERMTELVKAVTELIPNTKETTLQNSLDSKIGTAIGQYKSRLHLPKVSLTAITGIMTFLFAVPTQIKDNAALSKFLNPQSSIFVMVWVTLLLYTGGFWLITFMNEEKAKRRLSLLKVDSTQNELFDRYVRHLEGKDFSKDQLTEYIYERNTHGPRSILLFNNDIITMEVAQGISELIINRAEKKGLIEKSNTKSLSDRYVLKNYA